MSWIDDLSYSVTESGDLNVTLPGTGSVIVPLPEKVKSDIAAQQNRAAIPFMLAIGALVVLILWK